MQTKNFFCRRVLLVLLLASSISLLGFSCQTPQDETNDIAEPIQENEELEKGSVSAVMIVDEDSFQEEITDETSVWQFMNIVKMDEKYDFDFEAKEYPGMGFLIESINGLAGNTEENKYWIYYINGESATVGVSDYILQSGDVITWKYEESKF